MNPTEFVEQNLLEFALALATLLAWLVVEYALFRRKGKAISNAELVRLLNHENALLVDLRPEKDFHRGHIRKATRCDIKQLRTQMDSIDKTGERPIIFCCQFGARAGHAAQSLYESGKKNIYRLKGGIVGWETEGLPLQKGRI